MPPRLRTVPAIGPLSSRIVLIGEAPGETEELQGEPFCGSSGNLLKQLFYEVDPTGQLLNRNTMRIMNLLDWRPPDNAIGKVSEDTLWKATIRLHEDIARLPDPIVLVPTGNYPLFALTGKGKVKAAFAKKMDVFSTRAEKGAGISDLRGSVYLYEDLNGRMIKVIPTIHPAGVLRQYNWFRRSIRDWHLILEESQRRHFPSTPRRHMYNESVELVERYCQLVSANPQNPLSIDIETWGRKLNCVGFALSPWESMTIDLTRNKDLWLPYVKRLCECKCPKVLQNGWYDFYWLARDVNIWIKNYWYDTLCAHHCLNPLEDHDLGFLVSYYLRHPYYKGEGKEDIEGMKSVLSRDSLLEYNGLDCCLTLELFYVLQAELRREGMVEFYLRHYRDLFPSLLHMSLQGFPVDSKGMKLHAKELKVAADKIVGGLNALAGFNLQGKKGGLSNDKLKKFIYDKLGCKEQRGLKNRKGGKVWDVTLDKKALRKLIITQPHKIQPAGSMIMDFRSKMKKYEVVKGGWDEDSQVRCSYRPTTRQGRLASYENPMRTGFNLQNIEREKGGLRRFFKPFPGHVLLRADFSQIESRLCMMYTEAKRMIDIANLHPCEYDEHTENARLLFKVDNPTKEQRQFVKPVAHGGQRMMTAKTLAEGFVDMGIIKPVKYFQECLDIYFQRNWEIPEYFFTMVRREIQSGGVLRNSWGRRFDVRKLRHDHDLEKECCSFFMQSEAAELTNQRGVIAMYNFCRDNRLNTSLLAQKHDEVIFSADPSELPLFLPALYQSMESPVWIKGNRLVVPIEVEVGLDWDSGKGWKRQPPPEEMMEYCFELLRKEEETK
jgi:uracil-DNA glycosylase family 4